MGKIILLIVGFLLFIWVTAIGSVMENEHQDEADNDYKKPVVYSVPGMDSVIRHQNVRYKSGADELKMDICIPSGLKKGESVPAVIFVHGGYLPPDISFFPKDWGVFVSYGKLMAASGFVGVTFNHRYYNLQDMNQSMETSVSDITDAIQFVRDHSSKYNIDPGHIALWAFSGGGPHLSTALSERPEYIKCIVSYYAILDVRGSTRMNEDVKQKYSPVLHLGDSPYDGPAIFIARAGKDRASLNKTIDDFLNAALAVNAPVDFMNHPQGRHGFDILDDLPRSREIIARTIEFLKSHLEK